MPVFEYRGMNADGKAVTGHMVGDSLDVVARRLADQGMKVEQLGLARDEFDTVQETRTEATRGIDEVKRQLVGDGPPLDPRHRLQTDFIGPLVGGVPLKDLSFFFRQLGTMLNAGIEPRHALETLANQSHGALKHVLFETRDHVGAGRPMSAGFQRYPEIFSPMMMGMIRAGEDGGFLADQCIRLAEYIQRDVELRNVVRRETFYPKLVFFASIFIISAANVIINIVKPGAKGLDAPTLIWAVVLGLAVGLMFFGRVLLKNPAVKRPFDEIVLGIPYIGNMMHGFSMAMFGRAFGALYSAGMPLGRAMQLGADSCGNEAVRAKIYPVIHRLDEGAGVYETFVQARIFSPVVLDMVKAGEMTGNLNEMLVKVSEYYEDEGQTKARQAAGVLGVIALLVVAIYVGYVVINFYVGFANDRVSGLGE
ncbi:MAG: type II secretion system F family protein [Fimbriimonadaceae bacterium]|nr:MAG: type II secretion system F family protein [Fimbriimonadaceae bacterium]